MKNTCKLTSFIKRDTLLYAYVNKNKTHIYPEVYDFWNGMHILSVIAGCKSYIESIYNTFRLNLYIMYLNSKDCCMNNQAINDLYNESSKDFDDIVINSNTSVESMINLLSNLPKENTGVRILSTDIVNFFKNDKALSFYSDIYLCPKERSGYNGKSRYSYSNPYVNICASGRIDQYFNISNCTDFSDNFSTQTIIVTTRLKDKETKGKNEQAERDYERYKEALLQKAPFHITLSTSAASFYRRKYKTSRSGVRKQFGPREHTLAIKLAGLLAINDLGTKQSDIECTQEHIKTAYKILEYQQSQLYSYLNDIMNMQEVEVYDKIIEKIRKYIIAAGENGVTNNELYAHIRGSIDRNDYDILMAVMCELDLVTKYMYRNGKATLYAQNENTSTFNNVIVRRMVRYKNKL